MMDTRYLSNLWKEKELNKRAMVVILRTRGCSWRKCYMCNYSSEAYKGKITSRFFERQLEEAIENYDGEEIVKIYTSGSFLDCNEIPLETQKKILEKFEDAEKIIVESRPEFIIKNIENIADFANKVEVAIGLETVNDKIRLKAINKGFTLQQFEKSVEILKNYKFGIRTYILLKPPFVYEKHAIEDAINSVKYASKFSSIVSINPLNIQKNTLVEKMFYNGEYDPPWFWSLIEVLKNSEGKVISKPAGAGSIRGIHNCGKCDSKIINALNEYNNTLNKKIFDEIECSCKDLWKKYLDLEILSGSYGIPEIRRK